MIQHFYFRNIYHLLFSALFFLLSGFAFLGVLLFAFKHWYKPISAAITYPVYFNLCSELHCVSKFLSLYREVIPNNSACLWWFKMVLNFFSRTTFWVWRSTTWTRSWPITSSIGSSSRSTSSPSSASPTRTQSWWGTFLHKLYRPFL